MIHVPGSDDLVRDVSQFFPFARSRVFSRMLELGCDILFYFFEFERKLSVERIASSGIRRR